MDSEQFAKYLEYIDHPSQLQLGPNVSSLFCLYQEHLRRFPYHNLDLYMNKPIRDLSVAALLESVPTQGKLNDVSLFMKWWVKTCWIFGQKFN